MKTNNIQETFSHIYTGGPLGEIDLIRKTVTYLDFITEESSNTTLSNTDRKKRDNLLKEKKSNVPKIVEQIQQKPYHRQYKKNTTTETPKLNREKKIRKGPIHKL